jgi:NAD/NADP transhydrogenase alpha subunit
MFKLFFSHTKLKNWHAGDSMRLEKDECSLLASFSSSTRAQEAINALKAAGITEVQFDRVGRFGTRYNDQYNNPLANQANTITGLTLYSADINPLVKTDTRALLAADPSVSGVGLKDYGVAGNEGFLVTVVTKATRVKEAREILEAHGGRL